MKRIQKIAILLSLFLMYTINILYAQENVRYVNVGSTHALSIPEHANYRFHWSMYFETPDQGVMINTTTNVTENIYWEKLGVYYIQVFPEDKETGCLGEPIYLRVHTVYELSLHAKNDIYYTAKNTSVGGNVSDNDFDYSGAQLIYNPTPVIDPQNGTVSIGVGGSFNYTPNTDFVGVDQFTYEVCNDNNPQMCATAVVTIVVQDGGESAEIGIEKFGPEKILSNTDITYTLRVYNNGPFAAHNVTVQDSLPFGIFRPEYSFDDGNTWKEFDFTINIGTLQPKTEKEILIKGWVSPNSPQWLYNQAETWSDQWDVYLANNISGTIRTRVYHDIFAHIPVDTIFVPTCEFGILDGSESRSHADIVKWDWWPNGPDHEINPSNDTIGIFMPTNLSDTAMYIHLTVTNSDGFSDTDSVYVIVPVRPIAIAAQGTQIDTAWIDIDETIDLNALMSSGDSITYHWETDFGLISGGADSIVVQVSDVGEYFLTVTDKYNCPVHDTILVILESHPPVAITDTMWTISLINDTINVLDNDYDINDFNLTITGITQNPVYGTVEWQSNGEVIYKPTEYYIGVDSFRYQVCNDGYPIRCSEGLVIVNVERPPLNADVEIAKTGPVFGFYSDTIAYTILVTNNGPDTPSVVNVIEDLPRGIRTPEYSFNGGLTWETLVDDTIKINDLLPGSTNAEQILVRGALSTQTDYEIDNVVWIETSIIENDLSNDTANWEMWVKESVVADAGTDTIIGACYNDTLDATKSTGENITYRWEPTTYLDDPNSATPVFTPPSNMSSGFTIQYILTVTDHDNIIPGYNVSDKDTVLVTVADPPNANAGDDLFLELGKTVGLNGTGSSGAGISYQWNTDNGHFAGATTTQIAIVDSIGIYSLMVTDTLGCYDEDEVNVFQFYFPPFAVDDYYSTEPGVTISGNVMDNDIEPNGQWGLEVTNVQIIGPSGWSGFNIDANGSFTFTNPSAGLYQLRYTVCNTADPRQCATADVFITVRTETPSNSADLELVKIALEEEYLIGSQIDYRLQIRNNGPNAAYSVYINDVFSEFVLNPEYKIEGGTEWYAWPANNNLGPRSFQPGDTMTIHLRGTVSLETPSLLFNDAVIYSERTFDPVDSNNYSWVIVDIVDELIAVAEADADAIGACNSVHLDGTKSKSTSDIQYFWTPAVHMSDPQSPTPLFSPLSLSDTTVTIYLTVVNESGSSSIDSVKVYVAPEAIADGGDDQRINPGSNITLDGSNSQGENLEYFWEYNGIGASNGIISDPNKAAISGNLPGRYTLSVTDKYGCSSLDHVFVQYNRLEAVHDIAIVKKNKTFLGNVLTNDFDPDNDTITVANIPIGGSRFTTNGRLMDNPPMIYNNLVPAPNGDYIAADGSFLYQPNNDYVGDDYFDYVIWDDYGLKDTARVFIKVVEETDKNNPPVANNDEVFVEMYQSVSGNVLNNDYDFDGGIVNLRVDSNTDPSHGTLEIFADGSFTYTPIGNYVGMDKFEYMVCDNGLPTEACATATVFIHVLPDENNNAPIAGDDAYYSVERPVTGNILINDHDPDLGDLIFLDTTLVVLPAYADSFVIDEDGNFIYYPNKDFKGTDFFVYEICDDHPTNPLCANGTAYITVFDSLFADPEVEKTGPDWALSGDMIEFTIRVKNEGPSLANDIVITDIVDDTLSNVQYRTPESSGWKAWGDHINIDQMLPNPNSGYEYTFMIRGQLPFEYDGDFCNTVTVEHGMNDTDFDGDGDGNTSTWCTKVYQQLLADAGPDTVIGSCTDNFHLNASGTVGMDSITYDWRPSRYLDDGTISNPLFTPDATDTTYMFILTVRGVVENKLPDGSSEYHHYDDKDTVYISVLYEPLAFAHPQDSSYVTVQNMNEGYWLDGSASVGAGLTYQWWHYVNNDQIEVVADSVFAEIFEYGTYFLTVTDSAGCTDVAQLFVTYDPIAPHAEDDSLVTTIMNTAVEIYVVTGDPSYVSPKNGADWDMNNDLDTTSILVTAFPQKGIVIPHPNLGMFEYIPNDFELGRDRFTYQIWDETGLSDDALVSIEIKEAPPRVTDAFSPNGDGIHDFMYIENIKYYENNKIMIFNRWGAKLFEKEHYSNDDPWDGVATMGIRIGSGPVPTGTYYYILDLGDGQGVFTGEIYIASETRR